MNRPLLLILNLVFLAYAIELPNIANIPFINWSDPAILIIQNLRYSPITNIQVSSVDTHDYEKGHLPQDKFQGETIPARRYLQKELKINRWAETSPFTMELIFEDGLKGKFRIDMKHAVKDDVESRFWYDAPFPIAYKKVGNTMVILVGENK